METSPVNLRSESESNYIEDRSVTEDKKDLETIQSEENENSKEHDDLSMCDAVPVGKHKKQSSENLENMELLQKSTDAMNQLLDNMSNLEVNSTMETKVTESSEALIPDTNIENVKRALNAKDSGVATTNVTVRDLPPIRFHRVHGEYIKMSNDYSTARLVIPEILKDQPHINEENYIVFSSRPIAFDEKVYLHLEQVSRTPLNRVDIGFLDCDPNTLTEVQFRKCIFKLKYVYNYPNNEAGIFSFYVKPSGKVCYFMNDIPMLSCVSVHFFKVNIHHTPLWAVLKIPHNVTTAQFIDSPKENKTDELKPLSVEKPLPMTTNTLINLAKNNQKWDIKEEETNLRTDEKADLEKKTVENEGIGSTALGGGSGVATTNVLHPLRFHRVHGKYIKMSTDYCAARVEIPETLEIEFCSNCYSYNDDYTLFSSRPIAIGEKVYLRLETVPESFQYMAAFGLTTKDPNTIKSGEWYPRWLQYFSDSFSDNDNIVHFYVTPSGELCVFRNDEHIGSLDNIYMDVQNWAVIKLTLNITSVIVIDSPKENETEELEPLSIEKPSSPSTNDFDEPEKRLGDINNLNLNSTIDREIPESSKALQPETNIRNAKGSLEEEDCATSHSDDAMNVLTPLRFHKVHGPSVKISDDYCTAQLAIPREELCFLRHECLVFSSRPVAINEKVCLRLESVPSTGQMDFIRFCFTDCDPNTIVDLEEYAIENVVFCFMQYFDDEDNILHFYVKPSGKVSWFMKDKHNQSVFSEVNVNVPHWAVIKLGYNLTTVKLIDSPKENETEELKPLSIEKPSPPTTNALNEPSRQFGNILNLTTDREKLEFSKALKPKTNIENAKKPLEEEDCATSHSDDAMNVLTPLRFHRVHGQFIKISDDYCTAQSAIPLDKPFLVTHEAFAFSSRPVAINEKVYLRLEKVSRPYIDPFGFGFTDCDPNIVADLLPRLCRFRTCIFGNCLNYLPNNFGTEGNTFYFFVKPSGEVCYGINNKDMGCLSEVINIKIPLWGLIKLSNDISSVKLTESPKENETEDLKSPSEPLQFFPTKINTECRENRNPDIILKTPAPSSGISTEKSTVSCSNGTAISNTTLKNPHDLRFHSVHGKYIKLSPDKTIAKCEMPAIEPYYVAHDCYVFSSRPVDINEKVHLKLETVSEKYYNAFSFGFTDCDPSIIPNIMNRLCPSSPCILRNCLIALSSQYCVKDNYMHFYLNKLGEIHFGINEEEKGVCYQGVNTSSRVWAVIKVTNCVSSVRLERKKQDSFKSFFAREVSSLLKASSTAKEEETGASNKNIKSDSDDESKNSSANCNMLTGKLRTEVSTNTKGQTLFDWGVESTVKTEPEFNETESKIAQISEELFKSTLQPRTSNTPAKKIQRTSSTDVENNQESADYYVKHFAKIVEYHLHRVPEHRRMKCMQKILEELDTASK